MKQVKIYTTPTCSYCKMVKAFFADNNIKYEEYNVAADAARRQEMVDQSGQLGVPVIAITDETGKEETIIGFDQPALASALGF